MARARTAEGKARTERREDVGWVGKRHQDRSETPEWKGHSGGGTPRGEASDEGSGGQWNLGVSIAQLYARRVPPWEMWSHPKGSVTSIRLGAGEALAGGMVSKRRQEMLPGRAHRSGRFVARVINRECCAEGCLD